MKIILSFCLIFISFNILSQSKVLHWETDLNVATERAKINDQSIILFFTKSDCKPCQQFYNTVFKSETFSELTDSYILMRVDGSFHNDISNTDVDVIRQRRLVSRFNKSADFPSLLLINFNGEAISALMNKADDESVSEYLSSLKKRIKN